MYKSEFQAPDVTAEEFLQKFPRPVLLQFQPAAFKLLRDPEDLRQWEANLIERVGIKARAGQLIAEEIHANGGTCCESGSPSNDCDQD